jgi:DNA-directed RNA polymerase sigma subunit (sigma70/sigma32)
MRPSIPVTAEEEELALAAVFGTTTTWMRSQLVLSHLRLVSAMPGATWLRPPHAIVSGRQHRSMKAVKRFDPDRGVRLGLRHPLDQRKSEYIVRELASVKIATQGPT